MNLESKRIIRVLIFISTLFISLILYLSYFQLFKSEKIIANTFNKRNWMGEEKILRGTIVDRNGEVLAYSEKQGDTQVRNYPKGKLYGHIIGYSYREYGKAALESTYNKELLDLKESNPIDELKAILESGKEQFGNDLVLTIDDRLQKRAYDLLGENKGSIVLMNPTNGEVYAMVSNPVFNPASLKEDWGDIIESEESYLLNRSTMGLYAPGSIFKVITATSSLESSSVSKNFNCTGSTTIDGYTLNDYGKTAHGNLDLSEALVKSCNVAFGQMGVQIGRDSLKDMAERYMLNKEIPFDLKTSKSQFSKDKMDDAELSATAIGQGKTLVTPLNMALMTSAIANNGEMVKPILVKEVKDHDGETIKMSSSKTVSTVTSSQTASELKGMMTEVVRRGTGTNASIRNVSVAGKTGTAENETDKTHAWFVGFAPVENPKLAVAVILENSGSTGGSAAAPIARDIIIDAMNVLE